MAMDQIISVVEVGGTDRRFRDCRHAGDVPTQHLESCALAVVNENCVGRVAVYCNPYLEDSIGVLGGWACIDDEKVSAALLNWACDRLKTMGKLKVIGPMNGSTWYSYRFCTSRSKPAFFSDVDTPLHYATQFENYGFEVESEYISQQADCLFANADIISHFERRYLNNGYLVRSFHANSAEEELMKIGSFCIEAFDQNLYYSPISPGEFVELYLPVLPHIDPRIISIIEDSGGTIHGINFCLPNLLDPEGKEYIIKSLAKRRGTPVKGIANFLMDYTEKIAQELGYTHAIHALMQVDNPSVRISKRHKGEVRSVYRLYSKSL